ncbi:MAG: hypothetical protein CMP10_08515, partial [Zetaproteobacteria bacterium]|nr:hypothetical protein [Pseudobdellovibrionaceae bacterium]
MKLQNYQRLSLSWFLTWFICSPVLADQNNPWQNPNHSFSFGSQKDFFFGLATAPAHVEDDLDDIWVDWANTYEEVCRKENGEKVCTQEPKVKAFHNAAFNKKRLAFWSNPETEIELAKKSGVKVFRMGVDWGRLSPFEPGSPNCDASLGGDEEQICPEGVQDYLALERYQEIIDLIRASGMKVMLTLFHHSMPKWTIEKGGWLHPDMPEHFINFSEDIVDQFADDVDYWVTFNEPSVFILLSLGGIWPGLEPDPTGGLLLIPNPIPGRPNLYEGKFHRAVNNMVTAHKAIYKAIHERDTIIADEDFVNEPAMVGIAHNISKQSPYLPIDRIAASLLRNFLNYKFTDLIANHVDYMGLNYYGEELVSFLGVAIDEKTEYSESGRAINPFGLYELLLTFNQRYNKDFVGRTESNQQEKGEIPFIITENGISDSADILRPSYLVEHLAAIKAAMDKGVPIRGYVFWTISDNWEWADGYCPKFGLVSVERDNFDGTDFPRNLRPSFDLFSDIVQSGQVTSRQRIKSWNLVERNFGKPRPFCRSGDGRSSLSEPEERKVVDLDWRFKGKNIREGNELGWRLGSILNLPKWLQDKSRQQEFINGLETFHSVFEDVKFGVQNNSIDPWISLHLKEDKKVVCSVTYNRLQKLLVPIHLVFDPVIFIEKFRQLETNDNAMAGELKVSGVTLFIGHTGRKHRFSKLAVPIPLQKFVLEEGKLTMSYPKIAFAKATINLVDGSTPPRIKCETVNVKKFRNFKPIRRKNIQVLGSLRSTLSQPISVTLNQQSLLDNSLGNVSIDTDLSFPIQDLIKGIDQKTPIKSKLRISIKRPRRKSPIEFT